MFQRWAATSLGAAAEVGLAVGIGSGSLKSQMIGELEKWN